jgi:2-iminobutanoate/2-iminopropanoate deaminase
VSAPREKVIFTEQAVTPVGPYSQAVRAGDLLYISGTVPIDPKTGEVVEREIRVQTRQVMENIKAIVEAAGGTMNDLVKVNVHLSDAKDWPVMNEVYREFFGDYLPARMAMEAKPPLEFLVDIDAIAYLPGQN